MCLLQIQKRLWRDKWWIRRKNIKSEIINSGKNTQRRSVVVSKSTKPADNLVSNDLNMFKRVKSSYGNRPISKQQKGKKDFNSVYDSTKPSGSEKTKRCLSIRSGAFRI